MGKKIVDQDLPLLVGFGKKMDEGDRTLRCVGRPRFVHGVQMSRRIDKRRGPCEKTAICRRFGEDRKSGSVSNGTALNR